MANLILYSKPGCHLCEGLQTKLEQLRSLEIDLEVRDITKRDDWFQAFQYEIPLLYKLEQKDATAAAIETPLPRPAPRLSVEQLERFLQKYL
ncbi:MAG: glutaredoxin family protein [Acaryochloridaceae cyanobacterium SU_2_1]|nr:glutaredoxin family protein [Acaryochloridaceae cyanobacterium SU_2_1]